jgi:beta-galactosidase GanA
MRPAAPNEQPAFVEWMRTRYPDLAELNREFGLDYWSNRINRWEDASILAAELAKEECCHIAIGLD